MSLHHHSERASANFGTMVLSDFAMGCGRQELHMCKVKSHQELAALWPWLRKRIEVLRAKNPPLTFWEPEHVLMEITKGLAGQTTVECFVAHRDTSESSTLHGFLVVHGVNDPWNGLPLTWYVWMCVLEPRTMLQLMPEFETLARQRFYRKWRWSTSRKGWLRHARLFGANVVEYVFGKDL